MLNRKDSFLVVAALMMVFTLVAKQEDEYEEEEKVHQRTQIELIKAEINQTPRDVDVQLVDLIGDYLGSIKIPIPAEKLFNKRLTIRNPRVTHDIPMSKYIRSGIGIVGSMFINKMKTDGAIYVLIDTEFRPQFVVSIELPAGYKLSDLFPSFKLLDQLYLPRVRLIFSTIDLARDKLKLITQKSKIGKFDVHIRQGLTMVASLDLSGPLDVLRRLKEQAKQLDAIVVRDEPIYLKGYIPYDITKTSLTAAIPIRFGIDFTKIPGIPNSVTDVFKEFSTDDLALDVKIPKFKLTLEAGVRITLGTQPDPIRLSMVSVMKKDMLGFGGRIRNQLELKWLSLGDAGFQIDFDTKVMGATGLPCSGLGAYGKIQVGAAGESRASFEASSAIQIKKDEFPGLLWHVEASNIRFEDILALLISIAHRVGKYKAPFPADRIPVMHINTLKGYIATSEVTLARRRYKKGFAGTFDIDMFDQKVLFDFTLLPKTLQMEGLGYLSNVVLKGKRGKKLFSLTGPGLDQRYGTKDDGPVAFCSFDAKHPGSGAFGVRGTLAIPALRLKSKVDFVRSKYKLMADIENKIAGFTTLLQCKVDPLQIKTMFIRIGFKKDFDRLLVEKVRDALEEKRTRWVTRLDELNKKLSDFSQRVGDVRKKEEEIVDREIQETNIEIKTLEDDIVKLKEKLKQKKLAPDIRAVRKDLRQATTQLGMQKARLALLLKPGAGIRKAAMTGVEWVTRELAEAQILKKSAHTTLNSITKALDAIAKDKPVIRVEEIVGSYSMKDLLAKKTPKLDTFVVTTAFPGKKPKTVSFENLQFDFKKPIRAMSNLANKILKKAGFKD